jgi:hypothetical protein
LHPDYLLDRLTSEQVSEWQAYDQLDPVGVWRNDFGYALLCSVITNLVIGVHGKKGTKLAEPKDFLPQWGNEEVKEIEGQTVQQMKDYMMQFAKTYNTQFKRDKEIDKIPPKIKPKVKGK